MRQLAKTALIVAVLGAALYGVVAALAELPRGRWIITLILAIPGSLMLAFVVFDALRTGAIPIWRSEVFHHIEPARYWLNVGWHAAGALALGAVALWSGTEMMAAGIWR